MNIHKQRLAAVLAATITASLAAVAFSSVSPAQAAGPRPNFQLPFPCHTSSNPQQWRLDSWASTHAPALDMVKEPNQVGTEGALVVAPAAGTVVRSFYHSNAGNMIQINHGGDWFTTYIHLQSRSVSVGQQVAQGQAIGRVGRTGPTSNNHPHLHFELAIDGSNGHPRDGYAAWGEVNSERVPAWFNNVQYGTAGGQTYRNVTSFNSCTNPPPPPPGPFWVDTFANASVYASVASTGTLYAATNYVYCKVAGPTVADSSGNWNHWWLRTDPDVGPANQYVSAYYLSRWESDIAKDNNGTVIPTCSGTQTSPYWVDTFANASVYASVASTGTLNAGRNYVYCKVEGPSIGDSAGNWNHWWLRTDPDVGPANQYVSAYYLSRWGNDIAKDNDGHVIPNC